MEGNQLVDVSLHKVFQIVYIHEVEVHACLHTVFQTACIHDATGESDTSAVHSPVEEVSKMGSMRSTHCTALSRNIWSADSSKAPMSPPTTRMLVSNKLMRRLELHSSFVLTHSRALHCAVPELTASLLEVRCICHAMGRQRCRSLC